MPSDAFHALNRVADLIPAIAAKAVVYGGSARQSRTDGQVVPLADLPDLLQRFDVDPAAPRRSDSLSPGGRGRG